MRLIYCVFLIQFSFVAVMSLVALCYLPGDAQFEQTKREQQNEETSSSSVELSVSVAKGANPIAGTSSSGQDLSGGLVIESTGEYFPEPRASLCERIFFTWMTPLMRLGFRRPLLNSRFDRSPHTRRSSSSSSSDGRTDADHRAFDLSLLSWRYWQ